MKDKTIAMKEFGEKILKRSESVTLRIFSNCKEEKVPLP